MRQRQNIAMPPRFRRIFLYTACKSRSSLPYTTLYALSLSLSLSSLAFSPDRWRHLPSSEAARPLSRSSTQRRLAPSSSRGTSRKEDEKEEDLVALCRGINSNGPPPISLRIMASNCLGMGTSFIVKNVLRLDAEMTFSSTDKQILPPLNYGNSS